jgi:hypothetical protein
MLDLLVGQQDALSRYFTQKYARVKDCTVPTSISGVSINLSNSSLVLLPEFDAHTFEMYQIWLHTKTIHFRCQETCCSSPASDSRCIWQACWPLINAHILGCAIDAPECSDQVTDLLREKTVNAPQADGNTINYIFSENERSISDVLKRFMTGRYIDVSIAPGNAKLGTPSGPSKFVHAILDAALRRLSLLAQVALPSGCEYHTHDTSRACYKLSVQPTLMRREEKLELAREKSRQDAEEVLKNAESTGVKTVDWEEQTAEAKRVLMEQRGYIRVGFRRLDEQRPIGIETARGPAVASPRKHHGLPEMGEEVQTETCESGSVFGTALRNGAIDDVLCKAPSRAPPPPPTSTELPTNVSRTTDDSDVLP